MKASNDQIQKCFTLTNQLTTRLSKLQNGKKISQDQIKAIDSAIEAIDYAVKVLTNFNAQLATKSAKQG
jgi:hypothetical protein